METSGLTPMSMPHPPKTKATYISACERNERKVLVRDEHITALRAALMWDKRPHGSHGRSLQVDVPALNLCKGDRLEPSRE
eukprot:1413155-Alexandrium_andersonii.AAC.1